MYHKTNKYLKALFFLVLILSIPIRANAQNIKVVMSAPATVAADERFQLVVSVNANPSGYIAPNLDDFDVLMRTNQQSQSSELDASGRMINMIDFSYVYILEPKKSGKFTISPAQFEVKGKKYSSNNLSIEVTGNKQPTAKPSAPEAQNFQENDDLFLKVFLDKNSAYQGEFITATVKLYTRYQITDISRVILPSFDGFYYQDMETPPLRELKQELVNGKVYGSGVVKKFVLIPQKAGDFSLGSSKMVVRVQDGFLFSTNDMEARSKPVKVTIKQLPSRPSSFTGAVGKFSMDVRYDRTKVKANDPVILRLSVNGAGNLKLIEAPKISFPVGIETSEPSTTNKTNDKDGGISGTKQFEYLLIPRAPGKITLPPVEFSYFDPVANQYKTLSSPATTLEVEPGDTDGTVATGTAVSKEDLKFLGRDIEYIKTGDLNLKKAGSILYGSVLFYAGYFIPLTLFLLLLVWRRNYIRQNANMVLTRNRKAQKYAVKRLKKAKEYLAHSQKEKFYEEVLRALWGYLSDKLNIPVSDLSRETAKEHLYHSGVDEDSINRIMSLLDTCEFARYAPASTENTMEMDYKEAVTIITQIQERIR